MFNIINDVAYINGQNGIYDGKINNSDVRYSRNAVNNYVQAYTTAPSHDTFDLSSVKKPADIINCSEEEFDAYMKSLDEELAKVDEDLSHEITPSKFNLKYSESEKPNMLSVIAFAYEELGKKLSVGVQELTKELKAYGSNLLSAEALDLNDDGQVDLGEYSASVIVQDMMSENQDELTDKNFNGVITDVGQTSSLCLVNKDNKAVARNIFSAVYKDYNLAQAQNDFLSDENNLV